VKKIIVPKTETPPAMDVLRVVTETAQTGASLAEVRARLRLLGAYERSDGRILLLEDADYNLLTKLLNSFKFGVVTADLDAVASAVEQAEPYDPPAPAPPSG
jgi:hypothetical protein